VYTKFFGFKSKPFEITPDPKFLFLSESHKEALATLTYAVRERKGFTVITGEVGTGKTTLVQSLLGRLDGNAKTAYIFNPKLSSTDLLHSICEDFGMKSQKRSKGQYISQLHKFLLDCYARNENVVLIIDEAHTLDPKLLEEVRLLTNLETPKSKLLQVILIGQPELNDILEDPQFRQLKQRVSLRYHVQPLGEGDTKKYIIKRLRMAGAFDHNIFTPKALNKIYKYTKGIPRLINIICDNALLMGYTTDQKIIGRKIVHEAIKNLDGFSLQKKRRRLILFKVIPVVLLSLVTFIILASLLNMRWEIAGWIQLFKNTILKFYQEILGKLLRGVL
jgi:general secretion pathway protein A